MLYTMSSGDPETRKKIMETTQRLIMESRGQAVRMEDIAQASGVSRQAIYLHFGSRVGLMVATVQYVDQAAGFMERTRHVREEKDGQVAVALFIDFWADYVPVIYGLAKQLLLLKESDEAAAAAWKDRMESLRNGPCRFLMEHLERDGCLDAGWRTETAADFFWMLLSIQTWESLVMVRGWSTEQYATRLKETIERTLIAQG